MLTFAMGLIPVLHHPLIQVRFKVYEPTELQPLLDAANAEKEAAAQS